VGFFADGKCAELVKSLVKVEVRNAFLKCHKNVESERRKSHYKRNSEQMYIESSTKNRRLCVYLIYQIC